MGKKDKLQKVDSEAVEKELTEEELSTISGGGGPGTHRKIEVSGPGKHRKIDALGPGTHRKIDACADLDKLDLDEE